VSRVDTATVTEIPAATGAGAKGVLREFIHGSTVHGVQACIPGKKRVPTAYYTPDAGGLAVVQHPKYKRGEPMRVGLLGVGIGVMAAYCRSNDTYRCYEINPQVVNLATNPAFFSFLADAPGHRPPASSTNLPLEFAAWRKNEDRINPSKTSIYTSKVA
jgi:hypothetical protein